MKEKEVIFLTKEGLAKLKGEIKLLEESISIVIEAIKQASGFGDRSENSEYMAERQKKEMLENRLSELKEIITNHEVITKESINASFGNLDTVAFSAYVTYLDLKEDKTKEVRIVSPYEAEPLNNNISFMSPIARALLGKKVGYKDDKILILKVVYQ